MKSILSIDWLSVHCDGHFTSNDVLYVENQPRNIEHQMQFSIVKLEYGSRQFKCLYEVSYRDRLFATVQAEPASSILSPRLVIVKLANYYLYRTDGLELLDTFLRYYDLTVKGVSRLDIALDFQCFANGVNPAKFIIDYMRGIYRHVGRSRGNAHFNQRGNEPIRYNGISFGTHESSTRVYLYNKTLELKQVKDKPYIRDKWSAAGFDMSQDVWRLEISLKSTAMKFKDKNTGSDVHITYPALHNMGNVSRYYYTFADSLFSFVKWHDHISNITREPRVPLLPKAEKLVRWSVRESVLPSCKSDKIAIKRLWDAQNNYRIGSIIAEEDITQTMVHEMVQSKDLADWFAKAEECWIADRERGKII